MFVCHWVYRVYCQTCYASASVSCELKNYLLTYLLTYLQPGCLKVSLADSVSIQSLRNRLVTELAESINQSIEFIESAPLV